MSIMNKFQVQVKSKEGTGVIAGLYRTAEEAVLRACNYVEINWEKGEEAVATLSNNTANRLTFSSQDVVVTIARVPKGIFNLSVNFSDEGDRFQAVALLKANFKCDPVCTNQVIVDPVLRGEKPIDDEYEDEI